MKQRKLKIINFLDLSDEKYNKIREYRNQDYIREISLNTDIITEEDHKKYKALLEKEEKHFAYLIVNEEIDYSVITLEKIDDHTCFVGDYLVKEEYKYEGGGVVNSVCMNFILTQLNIKYIKAKQKVDNKRGNRASIVETLEVTTTNEGSFNEYLSSVPNFYDKVYMKSKPRKLFDKLYLIDKCIGLKHEISKSNILGRVKRFKNFYFGYAYDLDDMNHIEKVDMYIDNKFETTLEANLSIEFFLMAEDSKVQNHRFFVEIPEKIFDDKTHTISFKEHEKDIVLLDSSFEDIFMKNEKLSGDVWSINETSFVGWCKKLNSFESQNIDVFIDNNLIETITTNGFSFYLNRLYNKENSLGFLYTVPEKFFDNLTHMISFVPTKQVDSLGEENFEFCIKEDSVTKKSDTTRNGNIVEAYFYDLRNLTESKQIDMYVDDIFKSTIKPNMELPKYLKLDGTTTHQIYKYMFELNEEIFDNRIHEITFKEHGTDNLINNNISKDVFQNSELINGDVWKIDDFSFGGWCKQIGSLKSQNIDVFIDQEYIDTILTDIESTYVSQLFGNENKLGFVYKLPSRYFDYKNHSISFYPSGCKSSIGPRYFEFCISTKESTIVNAINRYGNIIHGYTYDLEDLSESKRIDMFVDNELECTIKVDMELPDFLKIEGQEFQNHMFMFELPKTIFDDKMHEIIFKEHGKDKSITNMIFKETFSKDKLINGDIWQTNNFEFGGWCKEISSMNSQNIDVYIDDVYVETISTNMENGYLSTLFGKNKLGFSYKVLEKYYDNKNHSISFSPEKQRNFLGGKIFYFCIAK